MAQSKPLEVTKQELERDESADVSRPLPHHPRAYEVSESNFRFTDWASI